MQNCIYAARCIFMLFNWVLGVISVLEVVRQCSLIRMNLLDMFWLSDSSYIWSCVLLDCGLDCPECECSNVLYLYYYVQLEIALTSG